MKKTICCAVLALLLSLAGDILAESGNQIGADNKYVINYEYYLSAPMGEFTVYIPSVFEKSSSSTDHVMYYATDTCSIDLSYLSYSELPDGFPKTKEDSLIEMRRILDDEGLEYKEIHMGNTSGIVYLVYSRGFIPYIGEADFYTKATIDLFSDKESININIYSTSEDTVTMFTDGILAHLEAP